MAQHDLNRRRYLRPATPGTHVLVNGTAELSRSPMAVHKASDEALAILNLNAAQKLGFRGQTLIWPEPPGSSQAVAQMGGIPDLDRPSAAARYEAPAPTSWLVGCFDYASQSYPRDIGSGLAADGEGALTVTPLVVSNCHLPGRRAARVTRL